MTMVNRNLGEHEKPVITRDELEEIVSAHELSIKNAPGGVRTKLVLHNLAGVDISHRNLAEANFSGSVFYSANLRFVNLARANLYCTDLRNVDGRYGDFSYADMRGATLSGSNLSHARLDHADFRPGRLARAGLWGIEEIIDRNGSAVGVDFSYCSLCGTSFENANLRGANLKGAVIHGTKFRGARLADVTFEDAVLTDINMSELQVPAAALQNCVLPPSPEAVDKVPHLLAKLGGHQRWVDFNARVGTGAVLDGEDLRPLGSYIGKYKLTAISARRVIAAGVDFSGTELQGVDFEGADLRGASFESADLRGAIFRNARLGHAKFIGADLRTLELRSGDLQPCDFTGADLSPEQSAAAIVD